MKREIKLRAWDGKQILEVNKLSIGSNMITTFKDSFPYFEDVYVESIMQFTGLQDKTGKDIYEGDIVMRNDSREPHEVVFEHGCFKERGTNTLNAISWEIIGNIYENPELL